MSKEKFLVFVDGDKYEWEKATITGAELRMLAAIPQNAQIYLKVPGKPCHKVFPDILYSQATLYWAFSRPEVELSAP